MEERTRLLAPALSTRSHTQTVGMVGKVLPAGPTNEPLATAYKTSTRDILVSSVQRAWSTTIYPISKETIPGNCRTTGVLTPPDLRPAMARLRF